MPVYARGVEYPIESGQIGIVSDDGGHYAAYWAHPRLGQHYPGVALLHDWWGITQVTRSIANFLAQNGYYVIAPDFFQGYSTQDPKEALKLLSASEETRWPLLNATLDVLEKHHRTHKSVAVLGLGLGGSLAFEAAVRRDDLEAAIACAGFPQRYLKQIPAAQAPILAIYGSEKQHVRPVVLEALRQAFAASALRDEHRLEIISGAGHEFFVEQPDLTQRQHARQALDLILAFLKRHLRRPG